MRRSRANQVIRVLEQVLNWRCLPQALRLDNGLLAERFGNNGYRITTKSERKTGWRLSAWLRIESNLKLGFLHYNAA